MHIITRLQAIQNLEKYLGQNLLEYANQFGITVFKEGKQNKGWKGLVLERLAGLENDNKKAPNGLGFVLKSVSFRYNKKKGKLFPKETMAITMLNPQELTDTPFFKSHCWEKLKSIVFCSVEWNECFQNDCKLLHVTSFDLQNDDVLIKELEADYEFIREKLINKGFKALTGKDGKWIQARTKGGKGSTSRAFYARPVFLAKVLEI